MVWCLMKVSATISVAEADRPRYPVQHILESLDIIMTAQAPVVMIWSRKLARSRQEQHSRGGVGSCQDRSSIFILCMQHIVTTTNCPVAPNHLTEDSDLRPPTLSLKDCRTSLKHATEDHMLLLIYCRSILLYWKPEAFVSIPGGGTPFPRQVA
jgi:hypothetical protein